MTYQRHAFFKALALQCWLLQCCYSCVIKSSFAIANEGNSPLVKYCFSHLYLPHYYFTALWNWMETECIPLASALCCVNGIFYLAWPAANEKTIHVWVHFVTTELDAVFPQQVTHSPSESEQPWNHFHMQTECTGWSVRSWQIHKWLVYVFRSLYLNVIIPCRCLLHSLHFGGGCSYQDFMGFVLFSFFCNVFGQRGSHSQAVFFFPRHSCLCSPSTRNILYFSPTPAHPALQSHRHCLLNYEVPSHSLTQSLT